LHGHDLNEKGIFHMDKLFLHKKRTRPVNKIW